MTHQEALKRESARDRTAEVVITHPPKHPRDRWTSFTDVEGPTEAALDHAAWIAQHGLKHATQCYEHMAPRVFKVEPSGEGRSIVHLSTNNYAGD